MKRELFVRLRRLATDRDGATLVEYGILLACIAAVSIPIVGAIGSTLQGFFVKIVAGF